VSSFDERAKEWDKNQRRQALAKAVAKAIEPHLPSNAEILDFGCGTGLVSYNLLHKASMIVGVDSSQKMREEFEKKSPDRSRFYATDKIPKRKFDAVLTSMTLHHIPDIEKLAIDFFTHLKPQGLLAVADLVEEDGTFHDHGNDGVHHFGFDPEKLAKTFEDAGFRAISNQIVFTVTKHKDFPIFLLLLQKPA
jgi:ubiquinone/menaquinone biosynthesis C-methylase UbiE